MKILHTADLHLTEETLGRWHALQEIVDLARQEKVAVLVIAGDLFDQDVAAETLRNKLRTMISSDQFQTIILPGNHDHKAYRSGLYYGENVTVVNNWEEPFCLGDVHFWGLPYEQLSGDRLISRLRQMSTRMHKDRYNILLFHGELLDAFFSRQDMGNEGDRRYMPAWLSYFELLPVQYVMAGHFHSRYATWKIPGGGLFTYPGSPVAVTRRESGQRMANLVKVGEVPKEVVLDTFHYEKLVITLDPFTSTDPIAELDEKLAALHPKAEVILRVEGLFNGSSLGKRENELVAEIINKTNRYCTVDPVFDAFDVQHVLEDDLYKQFSSRLESADYLAEHKKQVKEMVVHAFRVVK